MKLSHLNQNVSNNSIDVSIRVTRNQESKDLIFNIKGVNEDDVSNLFDWAIIGLLVPAMRNHEDIEIDGSISKFLNDSIHQVQEILHDWDIHYSMINIIPKEIIDSNSNSNKNTVISGFSAGVDSYSTLYHYFFNAKEGEDKINYVSFNNVGSHGKNADILFNRRFSNIQKTVNDHLKLPIIKINSNLDEFYDEEFQKNHVLRNLTIPFLLENKVQTFYYASGYNDLQSIGAINNDMSFIESEIFKVLNRETLRLKIADKISTRAEKINLISSLPETYNTLDVCSSSQPDPNYLNCGKCMKCLKTLVALESMGKINHYKNVFNLNNYYQNKDLYISTFLWTKDPHKKELIKLRENNEQTFTLKHYMFALFHPRKIKTTVYNLLHPKQNSH